MMKLNTRAGLPNIILDEDATKLFRARDILSFGASELALGFCSLHRRRRNELEVTLDRAGFEAVCRRVIVRRSSLLICARVLRAKLGQRLGGPAFHWNDHRPERAMLAEADQLAMSVQPGSLTRRDFDAEALKRAARLCEQAIASLSEVTLAKAA